MDYARKVQIANSGPELAGEMAAAMAAASIVFRDNPAYSKKLSRGAETVFDFARDRGKRTPYCRGNPFIEPYYNSTGYFDEYMWGAAWLFYATGNNSYFSLATNPGIPKNSRAFNMIPDLSVLSWDNKLPAAMLILTRIRLFLSPGYPYEDMLKSYHNVTGLTMCSYLKRYNVFNWTQGKINVIYHILVCFEFDHLLRSQKTWIKDEKGGRGKIINSISYIYLYIHNLRTMSLNLDSIDRYRQVNFLSLKKRISVMYLDYDDLKF